MPDDAGIARLAASQKRVVTSEQMARADFSWNAIDHRIKQGVVQRLWQGVYMLGPGDPDHATLAMAAVLTCSDAVLGYYWAGSLWGFVESVRLPVDVIVTAGSRRGRDEVYVHGTILLEPRDVTRKDGLPLTTPARTLLDLARVVTFHRLETLIADAMVLRLVNERHLREVIARSGRHPGAARLRRALDAGPGLTRSEIERILRRLLKAAGLPDPLTNHRLPQGEVDFYFPSRFVVVEVDGRGPHGTPRAFEHDRKKRSEIAVAGYVVLQFSDKQLVEEPTWVIAQIAQALATGAPGRAA